MLKEPVVVKNSGLTSEDSSILLNRYGKNEIIEDNSNTYWELILDTLKDPMIWFLLLVGSIFLVIGEYRDGFIILLSILPLLLMDAVLHFRTKASTSSLIGQLQTNVLVKRNDKFEMLDSRELVMGDIVKLAPDSVIPADGVWMYSENIQIDESALTGESLPIHKKKIADTFLNQKVQELVIDEENFSLAGTRMLSGEGELLILQTGKETEYSSIIESVTKVVHERTPLQNSILKLVSYLLLAAIVFCVALALVRLWQGHGWLDAFLSAATLAIAAIPEEFPVVFTFFLGIGVYRLAKKQALVRKAVSVENIGRINRICTDKTGTLTYGQLKLTHLHAHKNQNEKDLIWGSAHCAHAFDFDPIDSAIHLFKDHYFESLKFDHLEEVKLFPYTEDRKRECAIYLNKDKYQGFVKGAPETIFNLCSLSQEELIEIQALVKKLASEGHKVLAHARIDLKEFVNQELEPLHGWNLIGLLAFEDSPRKEILSAMNFCHQEKIKVTMITGDHPLTARAIAQEVHLSPNEIQVVSAEDCPEKFEEEWLMNNPDFLKNIHVIARCSPIQKLRVVKSLKKSGEIIAVTGDGVNDVPALKMADISISMGIRGSKSAKEMSHIILMDDNFSTIVSAIREGKQLFQNLRKSFVYLILFHIPFVLSAAIIPLLGFPVLYLPLGIVWLELIIHPSALFGFLDDDWQRENNKAFFSAKDFFIMTCIGILFSLLLVLTYRKIVDPNIVENVKHGRSLAMVMLTAWSSSLIWQLTTNKRLITYVIMGSTLLSAIFFTTVPLFQSIFYLSVLTPHEWLYSLVVPFIFSFALRLLIINK